MIIKKGKILVVDDDTDVLLTARLILKQEFKEIITESDPQEIIECIKNDNIDVVILDMNFKSGVTSGEEGLFWLKEILKIDSGISVVMNTAYGDIKIAVEAMKLGASEFIVKPWEREKFLTTIKTVYNLSQTKKEVNRLKFTQKALNNEIEKKFSQVKSVAKEMEQVYSAIEKVSKTEANILIFGENGTGKEVVAREIHKKSDRAESAFISVDLGALNENLFESELFGHVKGAFTDAKEDKLGRFEIANEGTLFLDEIGNLGLSLQSKLLSVIQNKSVTKVGSNKSTTIDVRLICASNRNLYEKVEKGEFRQDLLYRINTVEINLPPLRERSSDIKHLVNHFFEKFKDKYSKKSLKISDKTYKVLENYKWPGNIRELKHLTERAVIMAEDNIVTEKDFSLKSDQLNLKSKSLNIDDLEKEAIIKAIQKNNGNYSKASEELGMGRSTLYRKMRKYDI